MNCDLSIYDAILQVIQNGTTFDPLKCTRLTDSLITALAIKATFDDPLSVSLPAKLDICWHALLLETELYMNFCKYVCNGIYLHHTTQTTSNPQNMKDKRSNELKNAIISTYGSQAIDEWVWSNEQEDVLYSDKKEVPKASEKFPLQMKTLTGHTYTVMVHEDTIIETIYDHVQGTMGTPRVRLIANHKQLEPDKTVSFYNLKKDGIVHVVLPLC